MLKTLKPWNTIWAGLDLLNFLRHGLVITLTIASGLKGLSFLGLFNTLALASLILSLPFSAFYTFKNHKSGLFIYFSQLPFRLYFQLFTFDLLVDFVSYPGYPFFRLPNWTIGTVLFIEIIRITFSIREIKKH